MYDSCDSLPEIISSVQTPLPDAETARLALDDLGVVVEAVEDLPEEDDGHEDEVDAAEDEDVRPQGLRQLLPPVNPLVILPQMPLIERGLQCREANIEDTRILRTSFQNALRASIVFFSSYFGRKFFEFIVIIGLD